MNILSKNTYTILSLTILLFLSTTSLAQAGVVDSAVQNVLWVLVNALFGTLFGLAGLLFNFAINEYVIGFGGLFLNSGIGVAVDALWVSVRDIFNLTFIFGLVYIGFKMILGSDDSGTRKWLIHLILAALLVNFSLYITKFVVDVSNITASQIVSAGFALDPTTNKYHVSDTFMNSLGMQSIWGSQGVQPLSPNLTDGSNSGYGYIFGTAMLFIVAAYVFAAGAVMLIIRFVALLLYLVFSPLMFIGWVFPQMQSYTNKYWQGFLGRAFFAPVYILLLYFAITIIQNYYGSFAKSPDFQTMFSGNGGNIQANFGTTFPPFILACIFMIAAIVIASKMGADGAKVAIKVGHNLRGRAQRAAGAATVGTAAWATRNTAGRAAHKYANSDKAKRRASNSLLGQAALASTRGIAKSSFDARNVAGVGKGLGVGSGKTGGFTQIIEDKKKAEEKYAKDLGEESIYNEDGSLKTEVKEAKKNDPELIKTQEDLSKKEKEAKKNNTALTDVTERSNTEKQEFETKITELNEELSKTDDIERQFDLKQNIGDQQAKVADVDQRFTDEIKKATDDVTESDNLVKQAKGTLAKIEKAAQARAESQVTFSRQIDYINHLEKTAKNWSIGGAIGNLSAAAGVSAGGTLATGAGALAGATAASAGGLGTVLIGTETHAYKANVTAKHLKDKYGQYGEKMAKHKKRQESLDILKEDLKKSDSDDNSNSTPTPKETETTEVA